MLCTPTVAPGLTKAGVMNAKSWIVMTAAVDVGGRRRRAGAGSRRRTGGNVQRLPDGSRGRRAAAGQGDHGDGALAGRHGLPGRPERSGPALLRRVGPLISP